MKREPLELTGRALDWAVLSSVNFPMIGTQGFVHEGEDTARYKRLCEPSRNWADGGPLIEKMKDAGNFMLAASKDRCQATLCIGPNVWTASGLTPLVAAMRCFVSWQMKVKLPKGFT